MNYLDLFSGIGGFALGAYWAGWRFDKHYFSEIDPWCCKLYQQRFPDAIPLGDITKIDGKALVADAEQSRGSGREVYAGDVTTPSGGGKASSPVKSCEAWIISGGFPCQDISTAGKGAGITGTRSGLWFEYARLIGEIRPRYAIMENVGALTRRGLDRVLGSLAEIGYDAEWSDIRASDVGAPHRRERIWIVAYPSRSRTEIGLAGQDNGEIGGAGESVHEGYAGCREGTWSAVERWAVEPPVRCLVDGLPDGLGGYEGRVCRKAHDRVNQLKGLGNAIVPQIAEMIFRPLRGA